MKILEITWIDACGGDAWIEVGDLKAKKISRITTVGYLVKEKEDSITLTMSFDEEHEMYGAFLVIPKINIKKKRILK